MNEDFDARMRESRYEPSAFELDELKTRAVRQAQRGARSGGRARPRLVTAFLAVALMLSGGGAVIASTSGGGGSITASASQSQYVLPERTVGGSAQLAAPTGCVSKAFNARVRGTQITKVVFKLDGKTIKTLTKPNSGTFYQVRVNPTKFVRIGVHRVVALVTVQDVTLNSDTGQFIRVERTRTVTYRISFQRCAKKLALPRFTG